MLPHTAVLYENAMSQMLFCYCCRVHHPQEQMRLFPTRAGFRWRCIRSIEAATRSIHERDLFGQSQTAINREAARGAAELAERSRFPRSPEP